MAAKQVTPRVVALAALTVVLAVVLVATWPRGTADIPVSPQDRPRDQAPGAEDPAVPPPLGLEQMSADRATPANRRDLFRFGAAQPAPGPDAGGTESGPAARRTPVRGAAPPPEQAPPAVPQGPPQPPPIPLRYVTYAESGQGGPIAGFSDGRSVFHGRQGEVIEGKWRIVKISAASVVIERVDGTGRQTLPLAGGG